jgi:DNA-binding LytR/AlgR family response regulator
MKSSSQQSWSRLVGCRVLVLEDEFFLASDLEKALRAGGAEVIGPFADLESARHQVAQGGFDVAVIDINLRDQTTYVIADELRSANIPLLFATGYSEEAIPARFHDIRRWEKPYELEMLVEDVAKLCQLAAA